MTVVNSLPLCEGKITRVRVYENKSEESTIDFFVVCHRVLTFVNKMVIDERRDFLLTNFHPIKNAGKPIQTDHNTLILYLNIQLEPVKPTRVEMYNFKDKKCQEQFFHVTSKNNKLLECFENKSYPSKQVEEWKKQFTLCYQQVF